MITVIFVDDVSPRPPFGWMLNTKRAWCRLVVSFKFEIDRDRHLGARQKLVAPVDRTYGCVPICDVDCIKWLRMESIIQFIDYVFIVHSFANI